MSSCKVTQKLHHHYKIKNAFLQNSQILTEAVKMLGGLIPRPSSPKYTENKNSKIKSKIYFDFSKNTAK